MKKIFIFMLLLVTIGCTPVSKKTKCAYELINQQSKFLKQSENLDTYGVGTSMPDKIHSLHIRLSSTSHFKVEKVRPLFIKCAESFIDRINNDVNIRPYLIKYPITHENVEVSIAFQESNGSEILPPYVAYVFLCKGNIVYSYYDKEKDMFSRDRYREPYLEALEIVKKESNCK